MSVSKDRDSTIVSETITTARDESLYSSIREDVKTASSEASYQDSHKRMMNDKSNLKNHNRSGSESSILEEVQSQSSVDESKRYENQSYISKVHIEGQKLKRL